MHLVRLTPRLNAAKLEAEYSIFRQLVQSNPAGYPGECHVGWNSICVYSLSAGMSSAMEVMPYMASVISSLALDLRLVRLLALEQGGVIREHSDSFLSKRIVRLHIPIVSNPQVVMHVGGELCRWQLGELWYGDFSQPHSGSNNGSETRVHLVLDVSIDANLLALFPEGQVPHALIENEQSSPELDPRLLKRFQVHFVLPAGFSLPGTGLDTLTQATPGCVRLVDSELCVFVNEQPLLKAVPVSEESLDLIGLGSEARLEYAFNNNVVSSATLTLGATPVFSLDPQSFAF